LASTKKTTKTADTAARPRKESVPKPKTERPKLRSSHGSHGAAAAVPKKRTTRTLSAARGKAEVEALAEVAPKSRRARPAAPVVQTSAASDAAREVAVAIAVAALDKKAHALEILDVAGKVDYADFLVLMSGKSDRQVAALAQGIEDALRRKGKRALSVEGLPHAVWVLMDFGDVVVHVFQEDSRSLYDLDGLWMDARRIPVPAEDRA
jgi:ribosome-associated protein